MGSSCCEHCTGFCCNYLALPVDEPEEKRDFDDIRWYLMHEGVTVFIDDGEWYLQIETRCRNLREDKLCGIYETRPEICREYQDGECDYIGGDYGYDRVFHCPEDLEVYQKEQKKEKQKSKA